MRAWKCGLLRLKNSFQTLKSNVTWCVVPFWNLTIRALSNDRGRQLLYPTWSTLLFNRNILFFPNRKSIILHHEAPRCETNAAKNRWFGTVGSGSTPLRFPYSSYSPYSPSNYRLFRSLEHFPRKKRPQLLFVPLGPYRFYIFLRSSIFIRHWKANAQVDESDKRSLRLYFLSE